MQKKIIQITAGRGPVECCKVVANVQSMMMKQAQKLGLLLEVLDSKMGDQNGTLQSTIMVLSGEGNEDFIKEWQGTVLWIGKSPYRKFHKRKNWYIGIEVFDWQKEIRWDEREVKFETCRSSGPGGQNVNKVETAVRGIHLPSGNQVLASDSRSQLQNKKLCLERLEAKVMAWQTRQLIDARQTQWQEHNELERGNPVKVIEQPL